MKYSLQFLTRGSLLVMVFLFCALLAVAQRGNTQDGIRRGLIKVKFTPEMSAGVSKTTVTARSSGMTTGIAGLDVAAQATKASNMYRMFPFDAKYEHKLRKHGLDQWYIVEIDEETDPATAVAQFKKVNGVALAEVEHIKVLSPYNVLPYSSGTGTYNVLPFNDPMLKDQWHYDNTGQVGMGDADANVFAAWQVKTGANEVIVSVHDEGVDVNHVDLKANIWVNQAEKNGIPGVDDDSNGYIDDINGYNFQFNQGEVDAQTHGTHVAGTIAAVNNNGIGVSGIAGGNGSGNGVKIMSLQILGGAPIEKSYVYAANNGAVISQNSWGYTQPGYFDQSVKEAIDYFVAEAGDYVGSPMRGGIVIFAAGNSNSDMQWYPGYYPSTFAVASTGPEGKKAYYSNFGSWVELSAPGGDQGQAYGSKGGVLSTLPKDLYAYMQGTSMACPHVSGIAALAVANRTKQLTNTELWNKLVTGVNDVYKKNPDYLGKMGSGAIDALKAIANDLGKKPAAIENLAATDVAQEFAKLTWTVPADEDDAQPLKFNIYYSKQAITAENLISATKITFKNDSIVGKTINYEVGNLLGLTKYYFIVTSTDRWGNESAFSNSIDITTNDGPAIAVTPTTIGGSQSNPTWTINTLVSTSGTQTLTIQNNAAGLLRYNSFVRPRIVTNPSNPTSVGEPVIYPEVPSSASASTDKTIGYENAEDDGVVKLYSNEPGANAYAPITKNLINGNITNLIGETDLTLPNSAAAKFTVSEATGFNLTRVMLTLKLTRAATTAEPIVVEVYKGGSAPVKANLMLAQNYTTTNLNQFTASINLNEQLYFAQGETFWVVFHIPNANKFPLGMGVEADPSYSMNCLYSSNVGLTWMPLEDAIIDKRFAWGIAAYSANAPITNFISLSPASGDVSGLSNSVATITSDVSTVINANYGFNVVLASNDAANPEVRVPVYVKVQNQQPKVKVIDIVDYSSVFVGATKSFDVVMDNQGYGIYTIPTPSTNYVISGANANQFVVETTPTRPGNVQARDQATFRVTFKPTVAGTANATLTITGRSANSTPYIYTISLFGVGAATSTIALTPEAQTKSSVAIGDVVSADITVQNTGGYPLKYFIPGFDTKGVSDNWPSSYHKYGYKLRTNYATEANPIAFAFQDIKATGVDVTSQILTDRTYATVDIGFDFPYYGQMMKTIYIAQKGFTTFDNSVRPINTPPTKLGNPYSPKGYISLFGTFLTFSAQGKVYYKKEADRLIIQYDNVTDGVSGKSNTAQMVLLNNGDIRFYYKTIEWTSTGTSPYTQYLNVLVEDMEYKDGIILHNTDKRILIDDNVALGLDYPGPNIITQVTNGSGILAPGASAVVNVKLNTSSLVEGTTNRYINFISNDPVNNPKNGLVQLDITSGGTAQPVYSVSSIAFGDVFETAVRSQLITLKNTGTANVNISSMAFTNGKFILSGEPAPLSVKPGLYKEFYVTIPTDVITSLEDDLVITYADNSTFTIRVTGNVVAAPAISADLAAVNQSLEYKQTASVPYSIQNTGAAPLEVSVTGKQWVTFDATTAPASVTYEYEKHNTGGVYQWIDIRQTGVRLPMAENVFDPAQYWREIDLPFEFEYYGTKYSKIKLGDNGVATFAANPPALVFNSAIPTQNPEIDGPYIMPYWAFGVLGSEFATEEEEGLFYQFYEDKVIITWSYITNNFGGMGDPMSAQLFLYKNGTMKFQYKVEAGAGGGDQTSQTTLIGFQKSYNEGITISPKIALDYGTSTGLAYIMVPVKKHIVAAGASLTGEINFNSFNVYGGVYNTNLKINSNAPNKELQMKPVQLTVNALAVYEGTAAVDFGSVLTNPSGYEKPIVINNTGSAPLTITGMRTELGNQNFAGKVWANSFNPFPSPGNPVGWAYRWTYIDNMTRFCPAVECTVEPIVIGASEKMQMYAVYSPTSAAASNVDKLILTTNVGTYEIALSGSAYRAPGLVVTTTPINENVNTLTEVLTRSIPFSATNTNNGQGNLDYTIGIEFGRTASSTSASETVAAGTSGSATLNSVKATSTHGGVKVMSTYNRTLSHTGKTTAETYVGTGGSSPFVTATRYNSGPQGFAISHVETFFRPETLTSGKISVEIRAGGTSPATATKIAEGSYDFTASGSDETGLWITIPLDKVGGIYPNEDFYVLVTNPLGTRYPQGVVTDENTPGNRYFFYDYEESTWYDLNQYSQFKTTGWLVVAAEQTAMVTSWLNVTSSLSGSLAPGSASAIDLSIDTHFAQRGDQIANIVLTTNDPQKKVTRIPVSLHVNEAPSFSTAPDDLVIYETESTTVKIFVEDYEENTFTIEPAQGYTKASHTLSEGVLTVTITSDYGDAGNYTFVYKAKDEFNAESEVAISVKVLHKNRAPHLKVANAVINSVEDDILEYVAKDFFMDPDNDTFIYSVKSLTPAIAEVYFSSDKFIVKSVMPGESELEFTLIDSNGATSKEYITAKVDAIAGVEPGNASAYISAYPNPAESKLRVEVSNEFANYYSLRLLKPTGEVILTQEEMSVWNENQIDLSGYAAGVYVLEISNGTVTTVKRIVKF